jgi:hypothetical protein
MLAARCSLLAARGWRLQIRSLSGVLDKSQLPAASREHF